MNEQPQDGVSVISETSVYEGGSGGLHFFVALGWGTLAGTLGLGAAIILMEFPNVPLFDILGGGLFLSIVVGFFTLAGLVMIGLPVTFILMVVEQEYQLLYTALGAFAGFAALQFLFAPGLGADLEQLLFAASGGLAGGASAWRWGGWREALAIAREHDPIPDPQPED